MQNFKDSFYYPYIKFNRLSYFLMLIVPVFGFLSYLGYLFNVCIDLLSEINREPRDYGGFWDNFNLGLFVFIYFVVWAIIIYYLHTVQYGIYYIILILFLLPLFIMDFINSRTIVKGFSVILVIKILFRNFISYIDTIVKFIILTVVYIILSIPVITVFLTVPAWILSSLYLFSDFYKYAKIWEKNKKTEEKVIKMMDSIAVMDEPITVEKKIDDGKLLDRILADPIIQEKKDDKKIILEEEKIVDMINAFQKKKK